MARTYRYRLLRRSLAPPGRRHGAREGTAILAQDFDDVALRLGLSEEDLAEGRRVMAEVSVVPEALTLAAQGLTAMHDVTRGGLLETLLEIAYLSEVGIEVASARLPIPPVVSRFARAFHSLTRCA